MSYQAPSVQINQVLDTSGGVANTTPTLQACIIGPAYNVLEYVAGSTTSLIKTAAINSTTAIGSMAANSNVLTFASLPPFTVGTVVFVPGANADGTTMQATVTAAAGVNLTLTSNAAVAVTNAVITQQAFLSNAAITNTFILPGQLPGQVVQTPSIQIYTNNTTVQTISTGVFGYGGSNALVYSTASGTCNTSTSATTTLSNVTNPTTYVVGDKISITGAGAAGVPLVTHILVISGTTFTIRDAAQATLTATVMAKVADSNINTTTSTLKIENGDGVTLNYTDINNVAQTFSSTVINVIAATGNITNLTIADILPSGVSPTTTVVGSAAAAATSITVTSAVGITVGSVIAIAGAGSAGSTLYTTVGAVSGAVLSSLSPAIVTAITNGASVQRQTLLQYQARKVFNNQLIPATQPISGGSNYNVSGTATTGQVIINPNPELVYGPIIKGGIYIGYNALRTDLANRVMTINDTIDNEGQFGTVDQNNPLALGVQVALANTVTSVCAIAVGSNDEIGFQAALNLAQSQRLYALAVMTNDEEVGAALSAHCVEMSTPQNALWRVGFFNSLIPTTTNIGQYTSTIVNANSGNNAITLSGGNYILTASNATFISDGVEAGDIINITAGSGSPNPIGMVEVLNVVSNQQVQVQASGTATAVSYWVSRTLSNTQRAADVAATSTTFGESRLIHVQPDICVINVGGANQVLPGYYLGCALAGMVAGQPAQQGFTKMSVAGISDLSDSNFVFTRAQLDTMAAAGTLLLVQSVAGGIPYVRHELTTDMSTYYYRELQAVKTWDYISYFFYDLLSPFIGKWNITFQTLGIIRQTIVAGATLLMSQSLPKIGPPLLGYQITTLQQDAVNIDTVDVDIQIQIPNVLNYLAVNLII